MALVQPSFIIPVPALVKNEVLTYKFNFGIGNTSIVQSSKINIYDAPGSTTPIVTSVYNSTLNQHVVQADALESLTVEHQYYISIQTYTQINATGTASPESSRITVWCLNIPTLSITTPTANEDLTVNSFIAEALFDTEVSDYTLGINNKLNQYIFELLQGNTVVYTSGNIIGEGTPVSEAANNTQYTIAYNFIGVANGTYTLRITGITAENTTIIATQSFSVDVDISEFKTAQVSNNICEGYINIECNINNIEGETNGMPHNEGWVQLVDLPNDIKGYVKWDSGYDFPVNAQNFSNWIFQIWGFNFTPASYVNAQIDTPNGQNQNKNYVIQLRNVAFDSNTVNGEIDVYLVKTPENLLQAELYAYPYAQQSYDINYCIKSNAIPLPQSGTDLLDSEQVSVWVKSMDGLYEVFIRNITTNIPTIPEELAEQEG